MEEELFNISEFEEVNTANTAVKTQDFRLKVNFEKSMFTFSNALFEEMNLAANSLKQYNKTGENAGVYFALMPGNSGVWMKKKASSEKGKSHKNEKFTEALMSLGITDTKLDMRFVGMVSGMQMYKVVPESTPAGAEIQIPATPAVADDPPPEEASGVEVVDVDTSANTSAPQEEAVTADSSGRQT
jgi:hypothetical protein